METSFHAPESNNRDAWDALAPFYERHWGTAFFDSATSLFRSSLSARIKPGSSILDLCCGTGDFAQWLQTRGMVVSGVDNSVQMLVCAQAKMPKAEFYEGDMCAFRLSRHFDAVTCFYNSINEALTLFSVRGIFSSVREHLDPGGWFLFDVIQENGYLDFWEADDVVQLGGSRCQLQYRYDMARSLALCHASISGTTGEPKRDYTLYQRPFEEATIRSELARAGFAVEKISSVRNALPRLGRLAVLARAIERSGVPFEESDFLKP